MKHKKILAALLAVLMLSTAACGDGQATETPGGSAAPSDAEPSVSQSGSTQPQEALERSAAELAEAAFTYSGSGVASADIDAISLADNADDAAFYVENAYGLDAGLLEDFTVIRGVGASALELAALTLRDSDGSDAAYEALSNYIPKRQADFTGYNPAEAEMVSEAVLLAEGRYVCLFICPEADLAAAAVRALIRGEDMPEVPASGEVSASVETPAPPDPSRVTIPTMSPMMYPSIGNGPRDADHPDRLAFSPPNDEDMSIYDTSAILAAWQSGDDSSLSEKDLATLNAAREIFDSVLVEGMTSLEKEIALYHWCVQAFDYDYTIQDAMAKTPRESFEPYGGLVNHCTVCLGSATSFQLLMDLAGIECITVIGADDSNRGDHAWNMVKLYGNWYCVDVGWDSNLREDGYNREWVWSYFNVTSDYLVSCLHQWDYANTPEAITEGYGMY